MADDKTTIKDALKGITGLGSISSSWPNAKTKFPAIVVDLASRKIVDRRDDVKYLTENVYYVRIFGYDPDVIQTIFDAADPLMEALGYECIFSFDQNTEGALQQINHYSKTTPNI